MISAQQTRKIVQEFEESLRIYNKQLDLNFAVMDSDPSYPISTRAYYKPGLKQVVIIADHQRSEDDLQKCLYHEVFGHYGMSTFNEVDKAELLSTILETKNDPSCSHKLQSIWQNIQKNYSKELPLTQAEEVFARICEDKDLFNQTALQKVREKFVSILRKIPGINKFFTPSNEERIYDAAKAVTKGIRNGQRQSKNIASLLDRQFGDLENEDTYNKVFSKLGQAMPPATLQQVRVQRKEQSLTKLEEVAGKLSRCDGQIYNLLEHAYRKAENLNISTGEMYHALFNPKSVHEEDFFQERYVLYTLANENKTIGKSVETIQKYYRIYQREEARCNQYETAQAANYTDRSPMP